MNEKAVNVADKPEKKRKKIGKYHVTILLIGIGLMVAGIAGIVTSLAADDDYDNSTDIRTVDAVIETIERSEEVIGEKSKGNNKLMVDNINTFLETLHKMKVSFVVDGKTYGGRYNVTTYSDSRERDQFYHQLKAGDTIPVEVYRSRNGEYKIVDEEGPVNFLLYCAAIPVGLVITAAMIYDMVRPKEGPTNGKKKKKQQGKQRCDSRQDGAFMSFWDAVSMAAAITIALIGFAANKILVVDFTAFFRQNWESTKCKKMLLQRKGPWQGTNVHGEIRKAFDLVLLPLGKADKELLPTRMDKNFRRRMDGQIELLERR